MEFKLGVSYCETLSIISTTHDINKFSQDQKFASFSLIIHQVHVININKWGKLFVDKQTFNTNNEECHNLHEDHPLIISMKIIFFP